MTNDKKDMDLFVKKLAEIGEENIFKYKKMLKSRNCEFKIALAKSEKEIENFKATILSQQERIHKVLFICLGRIISSYWHKLDDLN